MEDALLNRRWCGCTTSSRMASTATDPELDMRRMFPGAAHSICQPACAPRVRPRVHPVPTHAHLFRRCPEPGCTRSGCRLRSMSDARVLQGPPHRTSGRAYSPGPRRFRAPAMVLAIAVGSCPDNHVALSFARAAPGHESSAVPPQGSIADEGPGCGGCGVVLECGRQYAGRSDSSAPTRRLHPGAWRWR